MLGECCLDNVDVFAMLFRQYRPLTKTGFFLNRGFLLNRFFLKKWFFRDPNILHTQASKTSFLTSLLFQNVLSCVQKMLGDDFDTFLGTPLCQKLHFRAKFFEGRTPCFRERSVPTPSFAYAGAGASSTSQGGGQTQVKIRQKK